MKNLSLVISLSFIMACGKNAQVSKDDNQDKISFTENLVESCFVQRDEELGLVEITCPDGSTEIIYDGVKGEDGESCSIEQMLEGSMISCGKAEAFIKNGTDGANGSACKVTKASNNKGALIECTDGSSAFIKNGKRGKKGKGEVDAVQTIIDPCGEEATSGFDEVILVLGSGEIIAHFSSDGHEYLTKLKKKKWYKTSDGTSCIFKINKNGEIQYQ